MNVSETNVNNTITNSVVQHIPSEEYPYRLPVWRLSSQNIRFTDDNISRASTIRIRSCDFNTNYYNISYNNNCIRWLRKVKLDVNEIVTEQFPDNINTVNPYFSNPPPDEWHLCTLYITPAQYETVDDILSEMNYRFTESIKSLFTMTTQTVPAKENIEYKVSDIFNDAGIIEINNAQVYQASLSAYNNNLASYIVDGEFIYTDTATNITTYVKNSVIDLINITDVNISDAKIINPKFESDKLKLCDVDGVQSIYNTNIVDTSNDGDSGMIINTDLINTNVKANVEYHVVLEDVVDNNDNVKHLMNTSMIITDDMPLYDNMVNVSMYDNTTSTQGVNNTISTYNVNDMSFNTLANNTISTYNDISLHTSTTDVIKNRLLTTERKNPITFDDVTTSFINRATIKTFPEYIGLQTDTQRYVFQQNKYCYNPDTNIDLSYDLNMSLTTDHIDGDYFAKITDGVITIKSTNVDIDEENPTQRQYQSLINYTGIFKQTDKNLYPTTVLRYNDNSYNKTKYPFYNIYQNSNTLPLYYNIYYSRVSATNDTYKDKVNYIKLSDTSSNISVFYNIAGINVKSTAIEKQYANWVIEHAVTSGVIDSMLINSCDMFGQDILDKPTIVGYTLHQILITSDDNSTPIEQQISFHNQDTTTFISSLTSPSVNNFTDMFDNTSIKNISLQPLINKFKEYVIINSSSNVVQTDKHGFNTPNYTSTGEFSSTDVYYSDGTMTLNYYTMILQERLPVSISDINTQTPVVTLPDDTIFVKGGNVNLNSTMLQSTQQLTYYHKLTTNSNGDIIIDKSTKYSITYKNKYIDIDSCIITTYDNELIISSITCLKNRFVDCDADGNIEMIYYRDGQTGNTIRVTNNIQPTCYAKGDINKLYKLLVIYHDNNLDLLFDVNMLSTASDKDTILLTRSRNTDIYKSVLIPMSSDVFVVDDIYNTKINNMLFAPFGIHASIGSLLNNNESIDNTMLFNDVVDTDVKAVINKSQFNQLTVVVSDKVIEKYSYTIVDGVDQYTDKYYVMSDTGKVEEIKNIKLYDGTIEEIDSTNAYKLFSNEIQKYYVSDVEYIPWNEEDAIRNNEINGKYYLYNNNYIYIANDDRYTQFQQFDENIQGDTLMLTYDSGQMLTNIYKDNDMVEHIMTSVDIVNKTDDLQLADINNMTIDRSSKYAEFYVYVPTDECNSKTQLPNPDYGIVSNYKYLDAFEFFPAKQCFNYNVVNNDDDYDAIYNIIVKCKDYDTSVVLYNNWYNRIHDVNDHNNVYDLIDINTNDSLKISYTVLSTFRLIRVNQHYTINGRLVQLFDCETGISIDDITSDVELVYDSDNDCYVFDIVVDNDNTVETPTETTDVETPPTETPPSTTDVETPPSTTDVETQPSTITITKHVIIKYLSYNNYQPPSNQDFYTDDYPSLSDETMYTAWVDFDIKSDCELKYHSEQLYRIHPFMYYHVKTPYDNIAFNIPANETYNKYNHTYKVQPCNSYTQPNINTCSLFKIYYNPTSYIYVKSIVSENVCLTYTISTCKEDNIWIVDQKYGKYDVDAIYDILSYADVFDTNFYQTTLTDIEIVCKYKDDENDREYRLADGKIIELSSPIPGIKQNQFVILKWDSDDITLIDSNDNKYTAYDKYFYVLIRNEHKPYYISFQYIYNNNDVDNDIFMDGLTMHVAKAADGSFAFTMHRLWTSKFKSYVDNTNDSLNTVRVATVGYNDSSNALITTSSVVSVYFNHEPKTAFRLPYLPIAINNKIEMYDDNANLLHTPIEFEYHCDYVYIPTSVVQRYYINENYIPASDGKYRMHTKQATIELPIANHLCNEYGVLPDEPITDITDTTYNCIIFTYDELSDSERQQVYPIHSSSMKYIIPIYSATVTQIDVNHMSVTFDSTLYFIPKYVSMQIITYDQYEHASEINIDTYVLHDTFGYRKLSQLQKYVRTNEKEFQILMFDRGISWTYYKDINRNIYLKIPDSNIYGMLVWYEYTQSFHPDISGNYVYVDNSYILLSTIIQNGEFVKNTVYSPYTASVGEVLKQYIAINNIPAETTTDPYTGQIVITKDEQRFYYNDTIYTQSVTYTNENTTRLIDNQFVTTLIISGESSVTKNKYSFVVNSIVESNIDKVNMFEGHDSIELTSTDARYVLNAVSVKDKYIFRTEGFPTNVLFNNASLSNSDEQQVADNTVNEQSTSIQIKIISYISPDDDIFKRNESTLVNTDIDDVAIMYDNDYIPCINILHDYNINELNVITKNYPNSKTHVITKDIYFDINDNIMLLNPNSKVSGPSSDGVVVFDYVESSKGKSTPISLKNKSILYSITSGDNNTESRNCCYIYYPHTSNYDSNECKIVEYIDNNLLTIPGNYMHSYKPDTDKSYVDTTSFKTSSMNNLANCMEYRYDDQTSAMNIINNKITYMHDRQNLIVMPTYFNTTMFNDELFGKSNYIPIVSTRDTSITTTDLLWCCETDKNRPNQFDRPFYDENSYEKIKYIDIKEEITYLPPLPEKEIITSTVYKYDFNGKTMYVKPEPTSNQRIKFTDVDGTIIYEPPLPVNDTVIDDREIIPCTVTQEEISVDKPYTSEELLAIEREYTVWKQQYVTHMLIAKEPYWTYERNDINTTLYSKLNYKFLTGKQKVEILDKSITTMTTYKQSDLILTYLNTLDEKEFNNFFNVNYLLIIANDKLYDEYIDLVETSSSTNFQNEFIHKVLLYDHNDDLTSTYKECILSNMELYLIAKAWYNKNHSTTTAVSSDTIVNTYISSGMQQADKYIVDNVIFSSYDTDTQHLLMRNYLQSLTTNDIKQSMINNIYNGSLSVKTKYINRVLSLKNQTQISLLLKQIITDSSDVEISVYNDYINSLSESDRIEYFHDVLTGDYSDTSLYYFDDDGNKYNFYSDGFVHKLSDSEVKALDAITSDKDILVSKLYTLSTDDEQLLYYYNRVGNRYIATVNTLFTVIVTKTLDETYTSKYINSYQTDLNIHNIDVSFNTFVNNTYFNPNIPMNYNFAISVDRSTMLQSSQSTNNHVMYEARYSNITLYGTIYSAIGKWYITKPTKVTLEIIADTNTVIITISDNTHTFARRQEMISTIDGTHNYAFYVYVYNTINVTATETNDIYTSKVSSDSVNDDYDNSFIYPYREPIFDLNGSSGLVYRVAGYIYRSSYLLKTDNVITDVVLGTENTPGLSVSNQPFCRIDVKCIDILSDVNTHYITIDNITHNNTNKAKISYLQSNNKLFDITIIPIGGTQTMNNTYTYTIDDLYSDSSCTNKSITGHFIKHLNDVFNIFDEQHDITISSTSYTDNDPSVDKLHKQSYVVDNNNGTYVKNNNIYESIDSNKYYIGTHSNDQLILTPVNSLITNDDLKFNQVISNTSKERYKHRYSKTINAKLAKECIDDKFDDRNYSFAIIAKNAIEDDLSRLFDTVVRNNEQHNMFILKDASYHVNRNDITGNTMITNIDRNHTLVRRLYLSDSKDVYQYVGSNIDDAPLVLSYKGEVKTFDKIPRSNISLKYDPTFKTMCYDANGILLSDNVYSMGKNSNTGIEASINDIGLTYDVVRRYYWVDMFRKCNVDFVLDNNIDKFTANILKSDYSVIDDDAIVKSMIDGNYIHIAPVKGSDGTFTHFAILNSKDNRELCSIIDICMDQFGNVTRDDKFNTLLTELNKENAILNEYNAAMDVATTTYETGMQPHIDKRDSALSTLKEVSDACFEQANANYEVVKEGELGDFTYNYVIDNDPTFKQIMEIYDDKLTSAVKCIEHARVNVINKLYDNYTQIAIDVKSAMDKTYTEVMDRVMTEYDNTTGLVVKAADRLENGHNYLDSIINNGTIVIWFADYFSGQRTYTPSNNTSWNVSDTSSDRNKAAAEFSTTIMNTLNYINHNNVSDINYRISQLTSDYYIYQLKTHIFPALPLSATAKTFNIDGYAINTELKDYLTAKVNEIKPTLDSYDIKTNISIPFINETHDEIPNIIKDEVNTQTTAITTEFETNTKSIVDTYDHEVAVAKDTYNNRTNPKYAVILDSVLNNKINLFKFGSLTLFDIYYYVHNECVNTASISLNNSVMGSHVVLYINHQHTYILNNNVEYVDTINTHMLTEEWNELINPVTKQLYSHSPLNKNIVKPDCVRTDITIYRKSYCAFTNDDGNYAIYPTTNLPEKPTPIAITPPSTTTTDNYNTTTIRPTSDLATPDKPYVYPIKYLPSLYNDATVTFTWNSRNNCYTYNGANYQIQLLSTNEFITSPATIKLQYTANRFYIKDIYTRIVDENGITDAKLNDGSIKINYTPVATTLDSSHSYKLFDINMFRYESSITYPTKTFNIVNGSIQDNDFERLIDITDINQLISVQNYCVDVQLANYKMTTTELETLIKTKTSSYITPHITFNSNIDSDPVSLLFEYQPSLTSKYNLLTFNITNEYYIIPITRQYITAINRHVDTANKEISFYDILDNYYTEKYANADGAYYNLVNELNDNIGVQHMSTTTNSNSITITINGKDYTIDTTTMYLIPIDDPSTYDYREVLVPNDTIKTTLIVNNEAYTIVNDSQTTFTSNMYKINIDGITTDMYRATAMYMYFSIYDKNYNYINFINDKATLVDYVEAYVNISKSLFAHNSSQYDYCSNLYSLTYTQTDYGNYYKFSNSTFLPLSDCKISLTLNESNHLLPYRDTSNTLQYTLISDNTESLSSQLADHYAINTVKVHVGNNVMSNYDVRLRAMLFDDDIISISKLHITDQHYDNPNDVSYNPLCSYGKVSGSLIYKYRHCTSYLKLLSVNSKTIYNNEIKNAIDFSRVDNDYLTDTDDHKFHVRNMTIGINKLFDEHINDKSNTSTYTSRDDRIQAYNGTSEIMNVRSFMHVYDEDGKYIGIGFTVNDSYKYDDYYIDNKIETNGLLENVWIDDGAIDINADADNIFAGANDNCFVKRISSAVYDNIKQYYTPVGYREFDVNTSKFIELADYIDTDSAIGRDVYRFNYSICDNDAANNANGNNYSDNNTITYNCSLSMVRKNTIDDTDLFGIDLMKCRLSPFGHNEAIFPKTYQHKFVCNKVVNDSEVDNIIDSLINLTGKSDGIGNDSVVNNHTVNDNTSNNHTVNDNTSTDIDYTDNLTFNIACVNSNPVLNTGKSNELPGMYKIKLYHSSSSSFVPKIKRSGDVLIILYNNREFILDCVNTQTVTDPMTNNSITTAIDPNLSTASYQPVIYTFISTLCVKSGELQSGELPEDIMKKLDDIVNSNNAIDTKYTHTVINSNFDMFYDKYFYDIRNNIIAERDNFTKVETYGEPSIGIQFGFDCLPVTSDVVKTKTLDFLNVSRDIDFPITSDTYKLTNVLDYNKGDYSLTKNTYSLNKYEETSDYVDDFFYNFTIDDDVWKRLGFLPCKVNYDYLKIYDRYDNSKTTADNVYFIKGKYYNEQLYTGPVNPSHQINIREKKQMLINGDKGNTKVTLTKHVIKSTDNVRDLTEDIINGYFNKNVHYGERMINLSVSTNIDVHITQNEDVEKIINDNDRFSNNTGLIGSYNVVRPNEPVYNNIQQTVDVNQTINIPDRGDLFIYLSSPNQRYPIINSEAMLNVEYIK